MFLCRQLTSSYTNKTFIASFEEEGTVCQLEQADALKRCRWGIKRNVLLNFVSQIRKSGSENHSLTEQERKKEILLQDFLLFPSRSCSRRGRLTVGRNSFVGGHSKYFPPIVRSFVRSVAKFRNVTIKGEIVDTPTTFAYVDNDAKSAKTDVSNVRDYVASVNKDGVNVMNDFV